MVQNLGEGQNTIAMCRRAASVAWSAKLAERDFMKTLFSVLVLICSIAAHSETAEPLRIAPAGRLLAQLNAADLAAPTGSSNIGFSRPESGAVSRTVQDKIREPASVRDFGAGSGGDDLAKFNAAATAAGTNG